MRNVAIDTRRPSSTKSKGQAQPNLWRGKRKYQRTWEFKCSFSGCVLQTLEGKAKNCMVIAERNIKTNELRYMAQEVIEEFNEAQGWMEQHRTGRKVEVIKVVNGVWKEIEVAIVEYETSLGSQLDKADGVVEVVAVDTSESFF